MDEKSSSTPSSTTLMEWMMNIEPVKHIEHEDVASKVIGVPTSNICGKQFGINQSAEHIGWKLYFPHEDCQQFRNTLEQARKLFRHFVRFPQDYSPSEAERCRSFDFKPQLATNDIYLRDEWPTFEAHLNAFPESTIACIGYAMYLRIVSCQEKDRYQSPSDVPMVTPRLRYFGPEIRIRLLGNGHLGKLVSIRGTIIRISKPFRAQTERTYRCKHCRHQSNVQQPYTIETIRNLICSTCRVRGTLEYCKYSASNRTESIRKLTIQDAVQSPVNLGEVVDVYAPEDMSDTLLPGDDVSLTGIVKADISMQGPSSNIHLRGIHIRSNKNNLERAKTVHGGDLKAIGVIRSDPFPFKLLVQSLCPQIPGMECIKAGLLLALFSTINDTHVLLAGGERNDTHQILQSCATVSPRGVFPCEAFPHPGLSLQCTDGGVECLVAGPLALADQGVCCVERIDELPCLYDLEKILEDGWASVSEPNTEHRYKVPVRTILLASTSPIGGSFDDRKPFFENFNLSKSFMEGFSLVFLFTDSVISEAELVCPNGVRLHPERSSASKCSVEIPLIKKLKLQIGEKMDLPPTELMRKYIEYARSHCEPEFTDESTTLLENFFSEMYSMPRWLNFANRSKISQIQNMVRARARMELSAEISCEHVMDTIRIVSRSWYDKYDTDDRRPLVTLTPKRTVTKASNIRQFLEALQSKSVQLNTKLFKKSDLCSLMNEVGLPGVQEEIIDKLNIQGYLLKKSAGCYELLI